MNRIIAFFKKIQLRQIVTIFLAGVLVLVSTACGGNPTMAKTADQIREEVPNGTMTNRYQGGMNDYRDIDPRRETSKADAKAKGLVDNAERNLTNRTGNPAEAIRRVGNDASDVGRNVQKTADKVGNKIERNAKEFGENAQQGAENLKQNAQKAVKGTKETVDEASTGAKERVDQTAGAFKRAADKVSE
jgi:ElaB/YqjD/DUF883 family membrane-anchored ribosome-binding protein